jgi:Tol biopolymer transport system component
MRFVYFAALACGIALLAAPQKSDKQELSLQKAIQTETVDGDLQSAIEMYRKIAQGSDRALAAKALVRMGQCYDKLGNTEARKAYDRVVREFADQKDAAAEASRHLAGVSAAAPGQLATRVVWSGPNAESEGTVSLDGRYLYTTDWDTGDLTVHDFSTGKDRRLTDKGPWIKTGDFAEAPAISRDGKQVAYAWFVESKNRYELQIAGVLASGLVQPRRLFDNPEVGWIAPHDWSPDGKLLAVEMGRIDKTNQIGLISVQDGSLRVLWSGTDTLRGGGFSPDGKYLLYTKGARDRPRHACILSVDGKTETALAPSSNSAQNPVWSADGSRILFISDRGGNPGLWSVHVADGKPQGDPELVKEDFQNSELIGASANGALFHSTFATNLDIYTASIDPASGALTSEPKRVNERAVGHSTGRIAWLPDSRSLSFWSNRNERMFLVLHSLATGEEEDLRNHLPRQQPVQDVWGYTGWFPDGRTTMSWQISGQTLKFRHDNPRSGEVLANWNVPNLPAAMRGVTVSADLMTLFFARKDEQAPCESAECPMVIFARSIETGDDREIVRTVARTIITPTVSPDGREIAFIREKGGVRSVMVASISGGEPRELYRDTDAQLSYRGLAWTKDSGHVLAFSAERGREAILSIPAKGGRPQTSLLHVRIQNPNPVVSPDGTKIGFESGNREATILQTTGLPTSSQR